MTCKDSEDESIYTYTTMICNLDGGDASPAYFSTCGPFRTALRPRITSISSALTKYLDRYNTAFRAWQRHRIQHIVIRCNWTTHPNIQCKYDPNLLHGVLDHVSDQHPWLIWIAGHMSLPYAVYKRFGLWWRWIYTSRHVQRLSNMDTPDTVV